MKLTAYNPPLILKNAVITGQLDHVGSAQSLGIRNIPSGCSHPQVYETAPGLMIAAACQNSNFPNLFWTVGN